MELQFASAALSSNNRKLLMDVLLSTRALRKLKSHLIGEFDIECGVVVAMEKRSHFLRGLVNRTLANLLLPAFVPR